MRKLLADNAQDLALLIGNGINRYEADASSNSWEGILTDLARQALRSGTFDLPEGVSLTELYDVLDIEAETSASQLGLQAQFCARIAGWKPLPQHSRITTWAVARSIPILTTNFEGTLGVAATSKRRRCGGDRFTAYYPWSTCLAPSEVQDPLTDFAIWHVNGMQCYRQSVRLGLSHYMGSVERARGWLHKSGSRLFAGGDIRSWPGANTWLQVFLHKPLLFLGLRLDQDEVFLRWLLIERAKYFRKFPDRAKRGWYAYVEGSPDMSPGKALFLRAVGMEPYPVASYDALYGVGTWSG
jgi:hypothetical protein